jgi:phosphoribosylanthranilate isomerase
MKIKVCGNCDLNQLKELDELKIDYAGMIFYPHSPRFVLKKLSGKEVKELDLSLIKVGVFVNALEDEIMQQIEDFDLDMVQLHGDETASFCNRISDHIKLISEYDEVCDYYLFDKGSAGLFGGTGQKFDWHLLAKSKIGKPFFLSGGIGIQDAAALKDFSHPFFYGVDVNSRFEIKSGIKNMELINEFVINLKK